MVKCADCGFLTWRKHPEGDLVEADDWFRQTGALEAGNAAMKYVGQPMCFARAFRLRVEHNKKTKERTEATQKGEEHESPTKDLLAKAVADVVRVERECSSYTPWIQGFTPKEHRERLDGERMLQWQAEREDADRKWRSSQQAQNHEFLWKLGLIAGSFAIISGVVSATIGAWLG